MIRTNFLRPVKLIFILFILVSIPAVAANSNDKQPTPLTSVSNKALDYVINTKGVDEAKTVKSQNGQIILSGSNDPNLPKKPPSKTPNLKKLLTH